MLALFLLLVACRGCVHKSGLDSADNGETGSLVSAFAGEDTAAFDDCEGLLGARLETPVMFSATTWTGVARGEYAVLSDQVALDAFWSDNNLEWFATKPIVDFTMAQVVVLQEAHASCWEVSESLTSFYTNADGDGGIVGAVGRTVLSCNGGCDTGGSPLVIGWLTPIGPVTLCRFGTRCE